MNVRTGDIINVNVVAKLFAGLAHGERVAVQCALEEEVDNHSLRDTLAVDLVVTIQIRFPKQYLKVLR